MTKKNSLDGHSYESILHNGVYDADKTQNILKYLMKQGNYTA